jgi:SAM-dependent methyltransferase
MSPAKVFSEVYARNIWGGGGGDFSSGPGSADQFGEPYCAAILAAVDIGPETTIVDLGCGDFRVGARLSSKTPARYIGVDVVPSLIEGLQERYGTERIAFRCLDITDDPLPAGNICLIRQVFQHLSNEQIANVVAKLSVYDRVFVTEHFPADESVAVPNLDKVQGAGTRVNSGVYLDRHPYSLTTRELLSVPVPGSAGGGHLRTVELLP